MSLANAQPIAAFPGFSWNSVVSDQVQEIVTTLNAESLDALNEVPEAEIAWAEQGTKVSQGVGLVKVPIRLPSSMAYQAFVYGGNRTYNSIDIAAPTVRVDPWTLNYAWPMIWNQISNGYNLMSQLPDGSMVEFMGVSGLAAMIVLAARAYKAQLAAALFYKGITSASMGLTAAALTIPQPGNPNGLPLFSNGTDSPQHYAHPFNPQSGRFKNLYEAYGSFDTQYENSLVSMTQRPHPSLPNLTMGRQVTDVFGPTWMRPRFFRKATQTLSLQTTTTPGNIGAATSNPYALENLMKFKEDTFIGAANFAPQRYWIVPALDSHPYFTNNSNANMTTGPNGGPADMWINVSASGNGKQTWCEFAASTKTFTPTVKLYGDGDPLSQSQRRVRLETDLDAGVAAGLPHFIDMFVSI